MVRGIERMNSEVSLSPSTFSAVPTELGSSAVSYNADSGDTSCTDRSSRDSYVDPVVAEEEERAVTRSRVVAITVLVISLAMLATAMFFIISNNEKKDFENQFVNYASEISAIAQQNAENTMETLAALSTTMTSYAKATHSQWPFVTVDNFGARAKHTMKIAGAHSLSILPVVPPGQKDAWNDFSEAYKPQVFEDAIAAEGINNTVEGLINESYPYLYSVNWTTWEFGPENSPGVTLPIWQTFPLILDGIGAVLTNYNVLCGRSGNRTFWTSFTTQLPTLDFIYIPVGGGPDNPTEEMMLESSLMQPIFEDIYNGKEEKSLRDRKVVGMIWLRSDWTSIFDNLLPVGVNGIQVVSKSTCLSDVGDFVFTWSINGLEAVPKGPGDLHDKAYDYIGIKDAPFLTIDYDKDILPNSVKCVPQITLSLYPSKEFEQAFHTNKAIYYTLGVVAIFVFTSLVFCIYDVSVRRRQLKVMARVIRQDKIVSNMFPTAIKEKLYEVDDETKGKRKKASDEATSSTRLAELYPSVSVVCLDLAGFTAWSSAREPSQVFSLLESIFGVFDKIAYHHGVLKVETVGDCYVAVAGLPEATDDHAIAVAKFARDCLHKMGDLTRKLEVSLGPDTSDLKLRVGMHSGQVTAGVLRGERSRFQLFGDTMNTASRMESTGCSNRIQVSSATAENLKAAKKEAWLTPRDDTIFVKGKGDMQTYWLETKAESYFKAKQATYKKSTIANSADLKQMPVQLERDTEHDDNDFDDGCLDDGDHNYMSKMQRLVEWNFEVLSFLLQQILAARTGCSNSRSLARTNKVINEVANAEKATLMVSSGSDVHQGELRTVLDEFKEIITLPKISAEEIKKRKDPKAVVLSEKVASQLRDLISHIADMYRPNSFHNFEHASHVTASVRKLLTRIVNADCSAPPPSTSTKSMAQVAPDMTNHSYGITSDPLTQFAVVFSAVIHDADHPGVPNAQLLKENTQNAQTYKKSIAEQNSVDLVWTLLMSPEYNELRSCIYSNVEELLRFRQLVVNTVMATDIVDKELQALRKGRWEAAFADTRLVNSTPELNMNRKATIVIEHLIQASDVSHTMQHWTIYKQWNERFFFELYGAYKAGRADTDPSIGWYKGEIGFFDFYIIPLAKKLESCGVFGVSSYEYLNYATANREEWVREGNKIVQEYIEKFNMTCAQNTNKKEGSQRQQVVPIAAEQFSQSVQ